jgi:DivIVA domain-containing protein
MQSAEHPEDLQQASFSIAFRGYDRDEVDAYVAELEEMLRAGGNGSGVATRAELAELLGEEIGALLASAEEAAERTRERGEAAERVGAREADKILEKAQAEASKLRATAEDESKKTVREAELKAKRLENAAKQRHDEVIEEAQTRIKMLRERERELLNRIDALEKAFVSMRHAADDIYKHNAPSDAATTQDAVVDLTNSSGKRGKA